jgi:hypothetical protein
MIWTERNEVVHRSAAIDRPPDRDALRTSAPKAIALYERLREAYPSGYRAT